MATDKTPLLGSEWVVEDIAGDGVIDRSHASLQFLPGGRLAGSATCNRILGSYESQGMKLAIKQVGATMMACPEALMNQERKLLTLLARVESYHIDSTGALVLST
ncbi:MAG: META domain-containing protein, partial [Burkholderiaceae bacterium]